MIKYDNKYYENVIEKFNYDYVTNFLNIDSNVIDRNWICSYNLNEFIDGFKNGNSHLIIMGMGINGVPHMGTVSQMLKAIYLQKMGFNVQIVLGDLDVYGARSKPLEEIRILVDKYKSFLINLGFDTTKGIIRNQFDFPEIIRTSFLLARCIKDKDFEEIEEDINELYKTDTQIHVLKNKELQSMHASEEDIKVLIQILNPKYFIPIKGEYQHFVAVSDVAKKMSIKDDNIIIVDNGEIITFNDGKLQDYRDSITIEDVMIDGLGIGDVGVKVIDDRNQLQNDGVVIIGMTIDGKTKEIVANTDVQTRGFIYLKDSENIVRAIIEMAEKELEAYKKDDNGDIRDVRQTIKDKANRYIIKETGKRPVILPVIIEL